MAQPNQERFDLQGQPATPAPGNSTASFPLRAGSAAATAQIHPLPSVAGSKGVPIQCQFCIGQRFRRSRLRVSDIKHLLLMRYPVRCLFCSQRQMVSFTVAGVSLPSHVRQPKKRKRSSRD